MSMKVLCEDGVSKGRGVDANLLRGSRHVQHVRLESVEALNGNKHDDNSNKSNNDHRPLDMRLS